MSIKQTLLQVLIIIFFLLGCTKEKDNSPSITMFNTSNGLPSDCIYCIKEDPMAISGLELRMVSADSMEYNGNLILIH